MFNSIGWFPEIFSCFFIAQFDLTRFVPVFGATNVYIITKGYILISGLTLRFFTIQAGLS